MVSELFGKRGRWRFLFLGGAALEKSNLLLQQTIHTLEETQQHLQRLAVGMSALYKTSLLINAQADIGLILNEIICQAVEVLGERMGVIYLMQPDGKALNLTASYLFPEINLHKVQPVGEGLVGETAWAKEIIKIPNFCLTEEQGDIQGFEGCRAIGIPLKTGDRLTGVLALMGGTPGQFSEDETATLGLFADQAAIAVENERLRRVEKALHDFMLELAGTTTLDEALALCLNSAIRISGLDSGGIYLYDHAAEALMLVHWSGITPEFALASAVIPSGDIRWKLLENGVPFYGSNNFGFPSGKQMQNEGLRALAVLPIYHQRQMSGCFILASHTLNEVPETGRAVLDTMAAQIGTIIARLQMEDALRESEKKAQALLNATNDAAYLLDSQGTVLGMNENGAKRFNRTIEEMLGKCIYDVFPSSILAERRERLEHVFQTGTPHKYEGERDGLWMESSIYPIFDGQGTVAKIAVFSRNITRQRTAEGKRAQLFEEVKAARAQLQERAERLEDANARLKELDRIKSQFLANMSHELRTPLNSIIGFSELLQDGILGEVNEQQRSGLEEIWRSSKHLLDLINDLLDFSRIENGRMTLHKTTFQLCDLLDEVKTIIRPLAEKKSQELEVHLENSMPPVTVDRLRLKQILLNLLSNACKFTQEGGHIRLSCSLKDNDQVQFRVADDGIGISPQDQKIIFEEFRQVDGTVTRSEAGSGLGLTISKRLVELSGGQIWVESQLGKGAVFTFLLPVVSEGAIQA